VSQVFKAGTAWRGRCSPAFQPEECLDFNPAGPPENEQPDGSHQDQQDHDDDSSDSSGAQAIIS